MYLPYNYSSDESVHLSITASWPNNSLDYYPGWYWVLPKRWSDWKKRLTSFEIKNPAINSYESFSSTPVCNSNWQPSWCLTMKYVFRWTDDNWRNIQSIVKAEQYYWQTWFVDIYDEIIENTKIRNANWGLEEAFPDWNGEIVVAPWNDNSMVINTYFWDDEYLSGVSFYKDVSKKFAFRSLTSESVYIWIAHSNNDLWWSNDKVEPEDMWELNLATIHVKANSHWTIPYRAWVWPGDKVIRLLTLDMDNIAFDSTSRPELVPYIDVHLVRQREDWTMYRVDANWEEWNYPIHRISLQPSEYTSNWKTIPWIDTSKTKHSIWPSGSFLCNKWTIWTPWFVDCYNDQSPEFKWITQHTIDIPEFDWYQLVEFTVNNASTYAWNAFAIAWDVDMFGNDVELEDLLPHLNSWVTWVTSVEVDKKTSDWENGFDDDGKETKTKFLHTYKTEVCNNTSETVNNVLVKLNKPQKSTLVGEDTIEKTESSLMMNDNMLENPNDDTNKLPMSTFDSQINLWTLNSSECKYLSYQVIVDTTVTMWDNLKVKNEFSYNWGSLKYTNEVSNPVISLPYDAEIVLDSEPTPWSDVYPRDYITYKFTVENTGLTDIDSWYVSCGRFADTSETTCEVWDCDSIYEFEDFEIWTEIAVNYAVKVNDWLNPWTLIEEQCKLYYEEDNWNIKEKDSNVVEHKVIEQVTNVYWWDFSLELYSRPKLLNTPDWNPRPDGLDQSPIKYTYKYTGSNHNYMYPDLSLKWSYTDGRWRCSSITWPNRPNSVTYNIHTTSTNPRRYANFPNNDIDYYLDTTLPDSQPKTTLYKWTLTPSHSVPSNEVNSWFKNWWTKELPITSTEHRALENGTDWRIESDITWTTYLDEWKYVPYDTDLCYYTVCWEYSCTTYSRSYTLYRWEMMNRTQVNFDADAYRFVTVWGSTAWLKTSNWHLHTNDKLTEEGTEYNNYDLWEAWYTNVKSAPKLYAPVGSFHWDYIVSSNTSTSNLKSKEGWYLYNKEVKKWHWYVYDRLNNSRDFYTDLIEKQKFWKVNTSNATTLDKIDMQLNNIYYYTWDLTLDKASWDVIVSWEKWTIVVEWDLYINSNVIYSKESKSSIKDLPFLWLIVKWSVYISPEVTDTVWAWHIDWTLHTWESVQTLRHLGNWTWEAFDFQRKAPEFYERDVNEPSERVFFDDRIYITTPPGFAELDDWVWSYKTNINQYTWEAIDW